MISITGEKIVVSLFNDLPSYDKMDKDALIFENKAYCLSCNDLGDVLNVEMSIGDYVLPNLQSRDIDCYQTTMDIHFSGCFDLCYITITVTEIDGKEYQKYTPYICVATTKETSDRIFEMLHEIEDNMPEFLDICFSKSMLRSDVVRSKRMSIWNMISLLIMIEKVFTQNLSMFRNAAKSCVEIIDRVEDINKAQKLTHESLKWITQSPNALSRTYVKNGIMLHGKRYMLDKVKTEVKKTSYNVYENLIITGFLKGIVELLAAKRLEIREKIELMSLVPENVLCKIPNNYDLTHRCVAVFYKGILSKLDDHHSSIKNLYHTYHRVLNCEDCLVFVKPPMTNTFKQIKFYRQCYIAIAKWFDSGDYNLNNMDYVFKLKTLSRIYEYYCLLKLQRAIQDNGYTLNMSYKCLYMDKEEADQNELQINNIYSYSNNVVKLRLFYEPYIKDTNNMEEIELYSTGYNFNKGTCVSSYWTPDFLFEIDNGSRKYYYIFDAKFSTLINIKVKYLKDLLLKYQCAMASTKGSDLTLIGICALFPSVESRIYNFKKNSNTIPKPIPLVNACSTDSRQGDRETLKKYIEDIILLVSKENT